MVRGVVPLPCPDFSTLEQIVLGSAQLGMLTRLANFPNEAAICPQNPPPLLYERPLTQPGALAPITGLTP